MWASVVMACGPSSFGSWALELGLSSYDAWALLLHALWDLPGSGIEPVFPSIGRLMFYH